MKRGADKQITKDDGEAPDAESEGGTWKVASAAKIAARTFVKARRSGGGSSAPAPAVSFGGVEQKTEGFAFDFGKAAEKKEETTEKTETAEKKVAPVNAFAALINKSNWECQACLVSNKEDVDKCAACEVPRAGSKADEAAKAAATPTFGFGGFKATTSAPPGTFTFGSSSFGGSSTSGASGSTGGFTFGGSTAGVTFGSVSAAGTGATFGSGPSQFEATKTFGSPSTDQTKEEFKDKKPEASGTEKDQIVFKLQCKVFVMKTLLEKADDKATEGKKPKSKFVECGEGELHINTVEDDGKKSARMVLRAAQTQRLVLNAPLFKEMTAALQGEKFVKFCSSCPEGKPSVYLLKVKNKSESSMVLKKMHEAIATLD